MPTLRLAPAEKLTTSVVFEIGSAEVGPTDVDELRPGDVVLLDQLTMDPDTGKGTATVRSEGPDAFLANVVRVEGHLVATLAARIDGSHLDPTALAVVLARLKCDAPQRPALAVGQRFSLTDKKGEVDLEWQDEMVATGKLVVVEGRAGVKVVSL